jgi:hypothetical protein
MQQALQAMQAAQQQMQQQMQQAKQKMPPMPPSNQPPQKSQDEGGLEAGERKAVTHSAWDVSLAPQDREVLSQVKADEFPSRYEKALVQYYRALAADTDK